MNEVNLTKSAPANRIEAGPFDLSELRDTHGYIDFGSILVPTKEDLQVRLDIEEATQRIIALSIDYHDSTLQLQAFAAPKSEGVWNLVRTQLKQSIQDQGGEAEERLSSLGTELVSRLALRNEAGKVVGNRFARFIGVDGPRWFLRGVIGGAAINDTAAAVGIELIFRSVAVNRGQEPIPPRDLLPLKVPAGVVLPPRPSSR